MLRIVFLLFAMFLDFFQCQELGEHCLMLHSVKNGTCLPFDKCLYAIRLSNEMNQTAQPCFPAEGRDDLVCCQKEIAEQQCKKYEEIIHALPPLPKNATRPSKLPHMVTIRLYGLPNDRWKCLGALISRHFVLTSAHCIKKHYWLAPMKIRLGDINENENSTLAQTGKNAFTSMNPRYISTSYYHDLALIQLMHPVTFTHYVKPACLYFYTTDPPSMILSQWQKSFFFKHSISQKQVEAVSLKRCRAEYTQFYAKITTPGEVVDDQMCGGYTSQKRPFFLFLFFYIFGARYCEDDFQGLFQYKENGSSLYTLVGLTTAKTKSCYRNHNKGIYTRVAHHQYRRWIEAAVWRDALD